MSHLDPDVLALIALGDDVTDSQRAHLASCAACSAEVHAFEETAAVARSADPDDLMTPPAHVWDAISADIEELEAAPPAPAQTPHVAPRRARSRRRGWIGALVATAAVIAAVATIWGVQRVAVPSVVTVADAVLEAFPNHPGAAGAAILEKADGHQQVVVSVDADIAAEGYREVWLIASDGSGLVSLGVLDGQKGTFAVPDDVDTDVFSLVDVSQEAHDGDSTHSGDSIVRGELRQA